MSRLQARFRRRIGRRYKRSRAIFIDTKKGFGRQILVRWHGGGSITWTTNATACYDYAQITFDYNSVPAMYDVAGFTLGAPTLGTSSSPGFTYLADWAANQSGYFTGIINQFGVDYCRALPVKMKFRFQWDPAATSSATNNIGLFIGGVPDTQDGLTGLSNGALVALRSTRGFKVKEMKYNQIISAAAAPHAMSISKSFKPTFYDPFYWKDPVTFSTTTSTSGLTAWTYPSSGRSCFRLAAGVLTRDGSNFAINTTYGRITYSWTMTIKFFEPRLQPNTKWV